jgi:hypothetical protein
LLCLWIYQVKEERINMKRIIGFFTILVLVLAVAVTSFATPQEMMMKKQPSMMGKKTTTTKTTAVRKKRKQIKQSKFSKYYKGRKIGRKSAIK